MALDKIRLKAQQDADRQNKPVAILNLNRFNPLYVIRSWDDGMTGNYCLVEKVCPRNGLPEVSRASHYS